MEGECIGSWKVPHGCTGELLPPLHRGLFSRREGRARVEMRGKKRRGEYEIAATMTTTNEKKKFLLGRRSLPGKLRGLAVQRC